MLQYFYYESEMPLYPMGLSLGGPSAGLDALDNRKNSCRWQNGKYSLLVTVLTELPPLTFTALASYRLGR